MSFAYLLKTRGLDADMVSYFARKKLLYEDVYKRQKLAQYPDALAGNADFIRQTWVGGRTTDCVGLIKGYGLSLIHI